MRIPSGKTDVYLYFVAVDATDLKTRETALSGFTVYRSRNNGAATAYTTPTVAELSAANMPGVYALLIDEDTTITAGADSEEVCVHITQAAMAPVTRTFELYRPVISSGQTITVANGAADADIERIQGTVVATPATAGILDVNAKNWNNLATVALPLIPTVAGRTLDVSATGEAGVDWANVGSPTTANALTGTTIATTQKVDIETIKTNPVVNAGTVTFPTTATLASTTNITAGTITTATNVTTVNGLAANVITAAATAADFGAEMADAVWDESIVGHLTVGSAGYVLDDAQTKSGDAVSNTADIQSRLPAALVGGRIDASVGAMAADVITAASMAADAGAEIADAVWDEATAGHTTAGTTGKALIDAGSAGDPWTTALPGAYGAGTAGKIVGDNINATISSRASQTTLDTLDDYVDTEIADIQARLPAALTAGGNMKTDVLAISGDAVAADNAESFFDGTGYAGTGNVIPTVTAVTGLTAANLDTTISSRMATYVQPTGFLAATFPAGTVANTTNITAGTITTVTNLTNAATNGDLTAAMKTSVTTSATAATPSVNVAKVNNVTIQGAGIETTDEWRPV